MRRFMTSWSKTIGDDRTHHGKKPRRKCYGNGFSIFTHVFLTLHKVKNGLIIEATNDVYSILTSLKRFDSNWLSQVPLQINILMS
jgi:hypothetical protein